MCSTYPALSSVWEGWVDRRAGSVGRVAVGPTGGPGIVGGGRATRQLTQALAHGPCCTAQFTGTVPWEFWGLTFIYRKYV